MEALLGTIQIEYEVEKLYNVILEKEMKGSVHHKAQNVSTASQELAKLEERKSNLQKTFLAGQISASDYSELKPIIETQIMEAKAKLVASKEDQSGWTTDLRKKLAVIPNVLELYRNSGLQQKKEILCSIFVGKFSFSNNEVRTPELDSVFRTILKYSGRFVEKKTGQTRYESCLSRLVIPFGFEPKTYCLEGSCSIQLSYGTVQSAALN